nr:MAG TPA: Major capsid protein [Caudoviricetes sp.]
MANTIQKFKKYVVGLLDEVYKNASKTAILDGAPELASQGANADELIIPKIDMDGLGDYDRNSGYTQGDVTFTNETVKCNFDRGRMFTVDNVDNMDTAGMAFGRLSGEFIRTKVVPELDAFRFATYAATTGADITAHSGSYADGEAVRKAIATKNDAMTDAEVPAEGRVLFINPVLNGMIRDMDTTKSKELLAKFAAVVEVPQARFYTAIEQLDGKSEGQKKGGFKKADSGFNLNFLIVEKSAVIQYQKHVAPKTVTPEQNQDADAYKFGYRNVGIADTYENKAAGIAGEYAGA